MDSKFNRNYRTVWNESLGQWVVASELCPGRRGKLRGVISRVACAILVAGGMLAAVPEDAEALTGTGALTPICTGVSASIVASFTGSCAATATDQLTIANTGTIQSAAFTVLVNAASTGVRIDNSGKILGGSRAISAVTAGVGTVINNRTGGQISASRTAIMFSPNFDTGTSLTNNGSIQVAGAAKNTYGISLAGSLAGTVANNGLVSVSDTNTNSTSAKAHGFFMSGLSGALTNSNTGTISASATLNGKTSTSIRNSAWGIHNSGSLTGSLTNNGVITATVTNNANNTSSSTATVQAFGIMASQFTPGLTGTLTNSGSISVSATNVGNATNNINVFAAGIGNNIGISGSMSNSGSITVAAANSGLATSSTQVHAVGIDAKLLTGNLTNTGTVSVSVANNGAGIPVGLSATGIAFTLDAGGVLNNSGTVSATSSQGAAFGFSLKSIPGVASAGGTVNNQAGGVLRGNININALANVAFNNAGTIEIPDGVTTASIAGSYTQQSGGMLKIGASSAASYAKLSTGPANLITGSVIDVYTSPGNTLVVGDVLTGVLSSTALTTGILTVTDNSNALDFKAVINGNQIDLQVVDLTPPVIALSGTNPVTVAQGSVYVDAGSSVTDNVDTGLIATVTGVVDTALVGAYTLTYNATDAAGNAAAPVTRTVNVTDQTAPVITLSGTNPVTVAQGSVYVDAGATASDNVDGNITANIATGGTFVDTSIPGTYTITYDVADAAGNVATQVVRSITVTGTTGSGTTGGVLPAAANSGICLVPSVQKSSQGFALISMLLTLLAGISFCRRRKD